MLRGHWGFTGTVVSDYWALPFLATMHRVAPDPAGAGALALAAGVDVELPDTHACGPDFLAAVRRGEVPEELVDRAVRRQLTQKAHLGLLDAGWTPEAAVAGAGTVDLDPPANRALARQLAERSIVLLDAGTALPLAPDRRRIAVVGPCADDPARSWAATRSRTTSCPSTPGWDSASPCRPPWARCGRRSRTRPSPMPRAAPCRAPTAAASRRRSPPRRRPTSASRSSATGPACSGWARRARVATPRTFACRACRPTCWPPCSTPGRRWWWWSSSPAGPTRWATCTAGRRGWCRRSCRGRRAAPRSPASSRAGRPERQAAGADPTPPFAFGHGRSYTTFALSELRVGAPDLPTDGSVVVPVAVTVTNTGDRAGDEVVQLYLYDPVAEVVRPVRQLIGFARVGLEPGASAEVVFHLHPDRTPFTGRGPEIVEAGEVDMAVGPSSVDPVATASIRLVGPTRVVGAERELLTPVELRR